MSFFEPPPPPPEPPDFEPHPIPEWFGSPRNELGAPVPLRLVLARTDRVAVALVGVTAYSTGLGLALAIRSRRNPTPEEYLDDPFGLPFGHPIRRLRGGELPPEILRFGVQFSDGRKATTSGGEMRWTGGDGEPSGPILSQGGGGGDGANYESDFWLWPLPPPGPVTFAVEWPAREIELSTEQVDASVFIEASRQSEALWPAEDAQHLGTQSSTFHMIGRREAPSPQED